MPFHITPEHMSRIAGRRGRRSTRDLMNTGKQTVEILAASGGMAYLQGWNHNNMPELLGIPADAGVGVLLHVLGIFDVGGRYNDDLHNFADGSLSWFFGSWAAAQGAKNPRATTTSATTTVTSTTAGWGGARAPAQMGVGAPQLTPQQVAAMAYGNPFGRAA